MPLHVCEDVKSWESKNVNPDWEGDNDRVEETRRCEGAGES
jgi:hypothetical protein